MDRGTSATTVIAWTARAALALVFLYAGGVKALDPAGFAVAIDNYRLLPYPAAAAVAVYLPWLEILCGFGVLWQRISPGALALLLGLCLLFSVVIGAALIRGLDISCGCFGEENAGRFSLLFSLARSISLALVCGWLLWRHQSGAARSSQTRAALD